MHTLPRTLATVLGFAALSAASTLAFLAPTTTFADPPVAAVVYTAEGAKIGQVVLRGRVSRDPSAKTGWVVLVSAENQGDKPAVVPVETDLDRTVSSPMARVAPMPQVVWKWKETMTLAAHQKMTRRYEVNAEIAATLTADAKTSKADANANAAPGIGLAARVYHGVRFQLARA